MRIGDILMSNKKTRRTNIVLVIVALLLLIVVFSMYNRIIVLENDVQQLNNQDLRIQDKCEGILDEQELINHNMKSYNFDSILVELEDFKGTKDKLERNVSVIEQKLQVLDYYDLATIINEFFETQNNLQVLENIIYSQEDYDVFIGRGIEQNSEFQYVVKYQSDGVELIRVIEISPNCVAYGISEYGHGEVDLGEYIENVFYYEHDSTMFIEVNGKIEYMFQGRQF